MSMLGRAEHPGEHPSDRLREHLLGSRCAKAEGDGAGPGVGVLDSREVRVLDRSFQDRRHRLHELPLRNAVLRMQEADPANDPGLHARRRRVWTWLSPTSEWIHALSGQS
jgi:hypothetical protein